MEEVKVYVVYCDQAFANFWYVVGVYSTREKAEIEAAKSSSYKIEEKVLDKPWRE